MKKNNELKRIIFDKPSNLMIDDSVKVKYREYKYIRRKCNIKRL